jgi:HKD family nuclease
MISLIHHPEGHTRLGNLLVENLSSSKWTSFRAAVAFVKNSGVKHIKAPLKQFLTKGGAKISAGVDLAGTSLEGITELLDALGSKGEAWIVHNEAPSTFHPKIYLFSNSTRAVCFIGSGNLTEGGLFTNYEAFAHLQLDKAKPDDQEMLTKIETLLDQWANPADGTCLKLTPLLIQELVQAGYLPTEAQMRQSIEQSQAKVRATSAHVQQKKLFATVAVKRAPHVVAGPGPEARNPLGETGTNPPRPASPIGFVITLQRTDVGHGQTTSGTSRRSPEIFLPTICVHANPSFWGWPNLFTPDLGWTGRIDKQGHGKMDRQGVRMRLGNQLLSVNWWYNPEKIDFRLRNEALRGTGGVGDILRIETAAGNTGFDYYAEVVPLGTSLHAQYLALCTQPVRNSKKKWGYY